MQGWTFFGLGAKLEKMRRRKKVVKRQKKESLREKILVGLGIPAVFIPGLILASILGWNWKAGLSRLVSQGGFYQSEILFPKSAVVYRVIDGDTLELENGKVIRLLGVNSPERGEDFYEEAKNYSLKFAEGKKIKLEYGKYQEDKFGRMLAYIWKDKKMLNLELVKRGLARVAVYKKRRKLKYKDELFKAEAKAREEKKGIWSH